MSGFRAGRARTDIVSKSEGELTPPLTTAVPVQVNRIKRMLNEPAKSGVQSPDRFATAYDAPPPLSQRHLLEKLAVVERQLAAAELECPEGGHDADGDTEQETDQLGPLPSASGTRGDGDDAALTPEYWGRSRVVRRDSEPPDARTPRQGRSRSRSRVRRDASHSRSNSPSVAIKPKAFAFFGHVSVPPCGSRGGKGGGQGHSLIMQDDSQSELSD